MNQHPITLADYVSALAAIMGPHMTWDHHHLITGGCERCHTALTIDDAYFARFGTVRCHACIGDDGFATVTDLVMFRDTGTLRCTRCGHPSQPAETSADGTSCTYHCPECGTAAHYSTATVA